MIYSGVELGGTKCVVILASEPKNILAREVIETGSPEDTLRTIETLLGTWKTTHDFKALGVASFGPADVDSCSPTWGRILATPKPGWAQTDVAARLQLSVGVPTAFDTDVNGAALAELRWGSGEGLRDFAYVTVGTGVGVGLIVDGKPTRGFAHCELGHIRVARLPGDDRLGSCPYHSDCVEGLASGTALKALFGDQLTDMNPDHPIWDSVAWALAQLCHAIVCAAAPRKIAIGGGVLERQPHLLKTIQAKLKESLNGFMPLPGNGAYVSAPTLGSDAGPLGAIALAMTVTH